MRMPQLPARGVYWKALPLILAVLSLALFLAAASILGPWNQGGSAVLLLFLLSVETLFLPYLLLPVALRAPSLLPWVHKNMGAQFSIDGPDRLAERIALGVLIVLTGLPVLTAYSAPVPGWVPSYLALPAQLAIAAEVPVIIFALVAGALAIPEIPGQSTDS